MDGIVVVVFRRMTGLATLGVVVPVTMFGPMLVTMSVSMDVAAAVTAVLMGRLYVTVLRSMAERLAPRLMRVRVHLMKAIEGVFVQQQVNRQQELLNHEAQTSQGTPYRVEAAARWTDSRGGTQ